MAEENNIQKVKQFEEFPIQPSDIVFVGNSLIESFPIQEYFSNVKNRGIGGNTLDHLISRISQITKGHPAKIFLEIGINDINWGETLIEIQHKFNSLITLIKNQSPRTKIYVLSINPTCFSFQKSMPEIKHMNEFLLSYCATHDVIFIDVFAPLLKNDCLDSALTKDGLHLNNKGYAIWRDEIQKYLRPED